MIGRRPPAWSVLQQALLQKKPVHARYHGHERILCPHALGWRNGRAKVTAFQSGGTTSDGPLPANRDDRWRCMFVDEVEGPVMFNGEWETADNHSQPSSCLDLPADYEVRY
jgi:hypothetical protein